MQCEEGMEWGEDVINSPYKYDIAVIRNLLYVASVTECAISRVGFLPRQNVFLPGQWKTMVKPAKTGNKFSTLNWIEILWCITMHH